MSGLLRLCNYVKFIKQLQHVTTVLITIRMRTTIIFGFLSALNLNDKDLLGCLILQLLIQY